MNELAFPIRSLDLFAGSGGGILGGKLLGWRTVCAVEIDPYCRDVLLARQREGHLESFPIWDDVTTFDGKPWAGAIDVISGGFPCQDISAAGKGAGIEGEKSGLWVEFARIIGEVRPRDVFVENSPMLTSRGLGTVLGDLASLGFNAHWGVLGAHHAGGNHKRDRIWITARNTNRNSESIIPSNAKVAGMQELDGMADTDQRVAEKWRHDARMGRQ
jgi:DNA (cytosine-5)-methyltransferase 1